MLYSILKIRKNSHLFMKKLNQKVGSTSFLKNCKFLPRVLVHLRMVAMMSLMLLVL